LSSVEDEEEKWDMRSLEADKEGDLIGRTNWSMVEDPPREGLLSPTPEKKVNTSLTNLGKEYRPSKISGFAPPAQQPVQYPVFYNQQIPGAYPAYYQPVLR
jgi:hypothetical protein